MLYSRLIGSLVDECVAASLGGYDVADVVAQRATGGDLIREVLARGVCDPRFKGTVSATKAWEADARDYLEGFAQRLLEAGDISREEAFERLDTFLSEYFLAMLSRTAPPDRPGREGGNKGGDDARKAQGLGKAMADFDAGPEEARSRTEYEERVEGDVLSHEDERRVELRFLRSIPSSLKRLARLVGRSDTEEAGDGHFLAAAKSDIAGITVGDDLGSVLPSEVALLAGRETEDVFFHRFVGKRLQVFGSASTLGREPLVRRDGPVVVCLDRSSSMAGRPSDIARALTLAVVILAKRRHREVVVVKYCNVDTDFFVVKNLRKQRKDLVDFLSYSCPGGNDEDTMFGRVFREFIPREKDFTSADVLCVSDFGWTPVGKEVMDRIQESKARGMKFYGLDVSGEGIRHFRTESRAGAGPPEIVDSMWIWDERGSRCYEER